MSENNVLLQSPNYFIFPFKYGLIRACKNDNFIVPSLYYYGEWCEGEIDVMKKYINEGDTVLDIGANWGSHSIAFSRFVGDDGQVHAFDPCSVFTDSILFNLELNEIYNVEIHNCAIGSENKEEGITVHLPDITAQQNYGEFKIVDSEMKSATTFEMKTTGQTEKVDLCTIDSFDFERVDMIKVDVEGMEFEVLKGAEKTIDKFKPYLFLESYKHEGDLVRPQILKFLESHGYEYEDCDIPFFNSNNANQEARNIFATTGLSENIFAIHKSKKEK